MRIFFHSHSSIFFCVLQPQKWHSPPISNGFFMYRNASFSCIYVSWELSLLNHENVLLYYAVCCCFLHTKNASNIKNGKNKICRMKNRNKYLHVFLYIKIYLKNLPLVFLFFLYSIRWKNLFFGRKREKCIENFFLG